MMLVSETISDTISQPLAGKIGGELSRRLAAPQRDPAGDSLSIDAAERRRGLRIRESRPIKIFEPAAARYIGGQTADISSTGLQIELPLSALMRPGRVVNVHVGLNDRGQALANRRQMIPARIVWVRRMPSANSEFAAPIRGRLLAGVEFVSSIAAHLDAA